HEADDTIRRVRALVIAAGTGSICFARFTQRSPRSRAAQLEVPRCERPGRPQRGSLALARVSTSARLACGCGSLLAPLAPFSVSARLACGCGSPNLTHASGCQGARASSGSQLAPVPDACQLGEPIATCVTVH